MNALDRVLEDLADRMARKLEPVTEFVDQTSAPCPRPIYMRGAKAGAFAVHRIGKRLLAKRADVISWIESHGPAGAPANDSGDDAAAVLARFEAARAR